MAEHQIEGIMDADEEYGLLFEGFGPTTGVCSPSARSDQRDERPTALEPTGTDCTFTEQCDSSCFIAQC